MRPSGLRHGDITDECLCDRLIAMSDCRKFCQMFIIVAQVTGAAKKLLRLLNLIKNSNVRDNVTMVQLVECWRGVGPVCRDLKLALSKTAVDAYKAPKELGGQENLMKIVRRPCLSPSTK